MTERKLRKKFYKTQTELAKKQIELLDMVATIYKIFEASVFVEKVKEQVEKKF